MKWSNEQLQAIQEQGKTILVNAGAGSGKTAVLTERLLEKVKSGIKLKNLIVLTFTKLAASEMKERLRSALQKDNSPYALEELTYIDQANIQTFDSFTNELVTKYHYLLNIPSKINIVDTLNFKMISKRLLTDIFKELYDKQDPSFFQMLDRYTVKDDKALFNNCLKLYDKIRLDSEYKHILNDPSYYFSKEYIYTVNQDYEDFLNNEKQKIIFFLKKMQTYSSDFKLSQHYHTLSNALNFLYNRLDYEGFQDLKIISFPRMPGKVEDEEEKENYNEYYDKLKKQLSIFKESFLGYDSIEGINELYLSNKNSFIILCQILKELDYRLNLFKKRNNCYDFSDVAFQAIELLENNEELRNTITKQTEEILVDEYQDTSDIQEKLISLISRNNVYMVGDLKQSIYRFRNTNPYIFKHQFETLANSDKGMVINLKANFRSRKEVLSSVNEIFTLIMSEQIGGTKYNLAHALNYGFLDYDKYEDDPHDTVLYTYDEEKIKESFNEVYKKDEIEAFIIANDIKNKLVHMKVYDKVNESNKYRRIKYSDFVILTSSKEKYENYKKIFEYLNIPLQIYKDEAFIRNDEIFLICNALKIIYSLYNKEYAKDNLKKALTAFLRSFVVDVNDQLIFQTITSTNVLVALETNYPSIFHKFITISEQIGSMTIKDLVDSIYDNFNLYEKMTSLYDLSSAENRINYMHTIINGLVDLNYSLSEVIDYFDLMITDNDEFDLKLKTENNPKSNAVRMMSIHVSKGLEFPICYFPELYKQFNFSDIKDQFIYNKQYKFILPYLDNQLLNENICKKMEIVNYHREEVSEKIRLLYVALTRVREQAILVCPRIENDKMQNDDCEKIDYKSFLDMIKAIYPVIHKYEKIVELNTLNLTKKYLEKKETKYFESTMNTPLTFQNVKLEKQITTSTKASMNNTTYRKVEELEKLKIGTLFHKALEIIDFNNPKDYLDNNPDLTINKDLLLAFFNHPLIKDMKIINTYHEYAFYYEEDNIIINGVIDLLLETEDKIYLIDYKLSNVNKNEYISQLTIYLKYLKKVTSKELKVYLYSIYKKEFKELIL